ncbi:MAG: hypothetical protein R3Y54_09575 [Eubacteriales bacterium]
MNNSTYKAKIFTSMVSKGTIRKNILPNTSDDYSFSQESIDLKKYKIFLKSSSYDDILRCKVGEYVG